MNKSAPFANTPIVSDSPDTAAYNAHVSVADQQSFEAATSRLRKALQESAQDSQMAEVSDARLNLRALAVKLRDAGFWRSDKQGLRSTVSLLWEADRFVNEHALLQPRSDSAD